MSNAAVADAGKAPELPTQKAEGRMLALDVLRGFTMFWIIGSDSFQDAFKAIAEGSNVGFIQSVAAFLSNQFKHRSWEGFVFYDLIFPMFVFIIGISLVFSLQKIVAKEGKAVAYKRVFKRFLLMFALAVFYDEGFFKMFDYANPQEHTGVLYGHLDENLLCGVLQRLALCYAITSVLFLNLNLKGLIGVFIGITVVYWGALTFVKAPDQPELSWARDKNIVNYVDHHIPPYGGSDPESWAGTPLAVTSCLLGVFVAFFLQNKKYTLSQKVAYLIAIGAVMTTVGYLWGYFGGYPIIKRLWTTTYVLVAGGFSCMLLGAFIYIIDIKKLQGWTPVFMWIGMNPLTIYMSTNILDYQALARRFVGGPIEANLQPYGALLVSIVALTISILIVRFLYQKKVFLRL